MLYRIGDFSKKTGLSIRTLRYYDEIDLFKPAQVDLFTGYRYYLEEQIEDVNIINDLKEVGFTLEEIKANWNKFDNDIFLTKKNELLREIETKYNAIRKIDYLRSNIYDGKLNKREEKHTKQKSLF